MKKNQVLLLQIAWFQSLLAMFGSLFFSEVMHLPPCILCWYQRIVMYPLVWILGVGVYRKDKNSVMYALPLALIGLGIAIYHNLLYYGVISEAQAPCTLGVSCTTKFFEWFGIITIPLLSLLGFMVICGSLWGVLRLEKGKN